MKRCDSTKDDRLKNGRIQKYRNRNQKTAVEGRFPVRLEAAEGGKSGRDSRKWKAARGIRKTSKDPMVLSDSCSHSSSKRSEVAVEQAGTEDKVAGTANNVDGTAGYVAGTADKVVDASGKVTGTASNVAGTADKVAGTEDKVAATANNADGTAGDVAGIANNSAGTADTAVLDPAVQTTTTNTSSFGNSNVVASPVLDLENDLDLVTLEVSCGDNEAQLRLNDLRGGSRRSCVLHNGAWLTPNEFQTVSGRGNAKDWKRSIRHHGRPLKALLEQGLLSTAPAFCLCSVCDSSQGLETSSNERKNIAPDNGVATSPIKKSKDVRTRTRTKISSSAKEHSETVKRWSRKTDNEVEFPKRNLPRKKTTTNEKNSNGDAQNQYGRSGARNSGKTTTTRKRTTRGSDLCCAMSADVASKRNTQRLLVKSTKGERLNGKKGKGRGRRKGKGKEIDKSGTATKDNFQLACNDDDDSRTIIDCGELLATFEPTELSCQWLNEAPAPLDDDREGAAAAADDDDDHENRKSRGISAAKPELAFCENFGEIEASETRRKRCLSTDKLATMSDEKRLKIEDDFLKDAMMSGKEQEEIDKEIDSKKDFIKKRSPKNGFDEMAMPIIARSYPLDGIELEPEHGEGSEKEDLDLDLKYRHRKIQLCISSRQAENHEDNDDVLATRRTDTILVIPSYHNSELYRNASDCNANAKEFNMKNLPELKKGQSDKSRWLTVTRAPQDASSNGRGRTRASGRGRGGGRAVGTASTKIADSTTAAFDAKCHETMTSDKASDDVRSVIQSDDVRRAFDTRKMRGRNRYRIRNVDSKFQNETPEEFPVESFPGALFQNTTTSSCDFHRFSEVTSEEFPVRSSGYFPEIRFQYNSRVADAESAKQQSRSGSTLESGPSRSSGRQPEPEAIETKTARRRSRRRQRNGLVSSTTSGYPSSAELMMTSLSRSVTSLYERQATMTSLSSSLRRAPDVDVRSRISPHVTDFHLRQSDRRCLGVRGVQGVRGEQGVTEFVRRSADGFSSRGSSTAGMLYHPQFQDRFDFRRILDFTDGVPLPGNRILAPGGDTCVPGDTCCTPFVYDHCGALDLTLPKVRTD